MRIIRRAEDPIVQVVVAKDPQGPSRIPGLLPIPDAERHGRVDHHLVEGCHRRRSRRVEELRRQILEAGGKIDLLGHRRGVVPDDIRGVLVLPGGLHESKDQPFVDVVLARFWGYTVPSLKP